MGSFEKLKFRVKECLLFFLCVLFEIFTRSRSVISNEMFVQQHSILDQLYFPPSYFFLKLNQWKETGREIKNQFPLELTSRFISSFHDLYFELGERNIKWKEISFQEDDHQLCYDDLYWTHLKNPSNYSNNHFLLRNLPPMSLLFAQRLLLSFSDRKWQFLARNFVTPHNKKNVCT